jgi:phosphate transport system permease protein
VAVVVDPRVTTGDAVRAELRSGKRDARGLAFQVLLLLCLLLPLLVLVVLLTRVISQAWGVFQDRGSDFLTTGLASDPAQAGVWQGLIGSFGIAVACILLTFPVGIGAAIYLEEYARPNRLTKFIQLNIRNLAGVPSVVFGILGLIIFVQALDPVTGGRSVIAAGLTMAVLVLPIVIITTVEALSAVPNGLREAGYGVGATRWEVVKDHVLPYAAPGILTGTILALARALGEAAPLILIGAVSGLFSVPGDASFLDRIQGPFTAMPYIIYNWAQLPQKEFKDELASAAILVLLFVVLLANSAAVLLRNHYEKKRG